MKENAQLKARTLVWEQLAKERGAKTAQKSGVKAEIEGQSRVFRMKEKILWTLVLPLELIEMIAKDVDSQTILWSIILQEIR